MVILRIVLIFLVSILSLQAREIEFLCSEGLKCDVFSPLRKKLENSTVNSREEIRPLLDQAVAVGRYVNFSVKATDDNQKLTIVFEGYKRIKEFRLTSPIKLSGEEIISDLKFKSGTIYSEEVVKNNLETLKTYLRANRLSDLEPRAQVVFEGEEVVVEFILSSSRKIKLDKVTIQAKPWVKKQFEPYFYEYYKKEFDPLAIKLKTDQISRELFNAGYFKSKVTILTDKVSADNNAIDSFISIELSSRINLAIRGLQIFTMQELRSKIYDRIKIDLGEFNEQSIKELIQESYEKSGVYDTKVSFRSYSGKDQFGEKVENKIITIDEGKKIVVSQIVYKGVNVLDADQLDELFLSKVSPLASSHFYDKEFFEIFSDLIKKKYYSMGFVQVEVSKPITTIQPDKSVVVEYYINERDTYKISSINLLNVEEDLSLKVKDRLINKVNESLNVVEIESDLQRVVMSLQEEGYYFANIKNAKDSSILKYNKADLSVAFEPQVELGNKICFNELIIAGTRKTKNKVIERELFFNKGDIITPSVLDELNQRLGNLGLFASLRITPYVIYEQNESSCSRTNILVQVKEKEFGLGEIAPGYRTDLGWKLSAGVTVNNVQGMNRQFSIAAQSNLRTSLTGFDLRRKTENKKLPEFTLKTSFIEPYAFHNLLKTQVEFEAQASAQRKRFYGFDADIYRISPQLSKSFSKNFIGSLRYQFERIVQFDASESKDNDNFFIGSITPSLTWDLRDDAVNTKKGAYFNLSSEWANKYFFSMQNDDLEINYLKLISRNRFYIPMGDVTLAMSISAGYQKNFANEPYVNGSGNTELNANGAIKTKGYIPSIKLFRLEGYDEVRGFEDSEINVVESGENIGKVVVQDSLYFANFKLEPRYNVTDVFQIGVFFDAGRLFQETFKPLKLRSSVGAGLKFLTPVGSLDFDYGIKLDRKIRNGQQESFGRFHLSIGFF